jgi:hypothetical protein
MQKKYIFLPQNVLVVHYNSLTVATLGCSTAVGSVLGAVRVLEASGISADHSRTAVLLILCTLQQYYHKNMTLIQTFSTTYPSSAA